MDSKANLFVSDKNLVERIAYALIDGYPLKKKQLKRWIYDLDYTQSYVARKLGLTPIEFKRKLQEKEKFNREQITKLVYLMGAEEAFKVIYFPTVQMREEVRQKVFGNYKNKEELNE